MGIARLFGMRVSRQSMLLVACALAPGCVNPGHQVVAVSGTTLGVKIAQNPSNGSIEGKFGYNRAELALVPTNRASGENAQGSQEVDGRAGAAESANVLMELQYKGIFSPGPGSGVYQRLAVGDTAVLQDGADFLMAKDADGHLDANALRAMQAIEAIPEVSGELTERLLPFCEEWRSAESTPQTKSDYQAVVDAYNRQEGRVVYRNFGEICSGSDAAAATTVIAMLREAGLRGLQ